MNRWKTTEGAVTNDFKVQKAKEAAAEAEAEGRGGFHFGRETGVIQGQLFDRVAQVFELGGVNREKAAEYNGLGGFEAGQRFKAALAFVGDGVANAGIADLLDLGGEDADLTRPQLGNVDHLRLQNGEFFDGVDRVGLHHADPVALFHHAVHDAQHDDHAKVGVIPAVDQHRLQGRIAVALRRRQAGNDGFEHVGNPEAGFGRDQHRVRGVKADDVLDLLADAFGFGGGQVDLVQDGHDFVAGIQRLIDVGQSLRLNPLRGVNHQQRSLNRAHRAADLIAEVDMTGGVDQVQDIGLAVLGLVVDPDRVGLDRDAALPLDIHAVQQLGLHVAVGDSAG
jgi:hypothetical protein